LEPITHFLTGACLGRAGLNRKTGLATATVTLAAEAPDIDVLGRIKGPVFGFAHHRGFTHSFLGLTLVSAAVVAVMYLVWRISGRKISHPHGPPRWGLLFLFAYAAGLSHILLDFTNNYGVRPFWPFSGKWYSWDIVFIVEPVILILLIAGLAVPALSAASSKNSKKSSNTTAHSGPVGRLAATLALFGVVALWGVRDFEHRRALDFVRSRSYQGAALIRASVYPYWWNPFRWHSVAETQNFYATMGVRSSTGDISQVRVYPKPEQSPVTLAARKSYLGRVYLDWAKYPLVEVYRLKDAGAIGYRVQFEDLRYASPETTGRGPLTASEELNSNLEVVDEGFGSRSEHGTPSP
jgi:inner membrane protein